jgi:hypothetical protein
MSCNTGIQQSEEKERGRQDALTGGPVKVTP